MKGSKVDAWGLEWDRRYMLVEADSGEFVTIRKFPKMVGAARMPGNARLHRAWIILIEQQPCAVAYQDKAGGRPAVCHSGRYVGARGAGC